MLEISGKHNTAKVFTDILDEYSQSQIENLCNQSFVKGSSIRLMPDVHAGAGCTIGTTMTISDKIVPNLVGVDIGCGMETIVIKSDSQFAKDFDPSRIDKLSIIKFPAEWKSGMTSMNLHPQLIWKISVVRQLILRAQKRASVHLGEGIILLK